MSQGEPFPLLYFALDCQNSKVPALHYTAGAKLQEAMGAVRNPLFDIF
jgi:hypothetical protein